MTGRVKRRIGLAQAGRRTTVPEPVRCALCGRSLGERVEWHHPLPKSQGGRETVPLHPICHRTIHATLTNAELAHGFATMTALRDHPAIARFLDWIADKPADFHVPTRRTR